MTVLKAILLSALTVTVQLQYTEALMNGLKIKKINTAEIIALLSCSTLIYSSSGRVQTNKFIFHFSRKFIKSSERFLFLGSFCK